MSPSLDGPVRSVAAEMAERYEEIARREVRRWGECLWTARDRLPPLLYRAPTVEAAWQPDGSVRVIFRIAAGIAEL